MNCRIGTIRFWFKPHWSSNPNTGGTGGYAKLFAVSDPNSANYWNLQFATNGCSLTFGAQTNSNGFINYFAVPCCLVANVWYQFALTYSPTNIAFYTNGILTATSTGVPYQS